MTQHIFSSGTWKTEAGGSLNAGPACIMRPCLDDDDEEKNLFRKKGHMAAVFCLFVFNLYFRLNPGCHTARALATIPSLLVHF